MVRFFVRLYIYRVCFSDICGIVVVAKAPFAFSASVLSVMDQTLSKVVWFIISVNCLRLVNLCPLFGFWLSSVQDRPQLAFANLCFWVRD